MSYVLLLVEAIVITVVFGSKVVVFPNGSISTYSFAFASTAKYATSKMFAVEIITSPDAMARCISWLKYSYPSPNESKLISNFWKYAPNEIVSLPDIVTSIYVKDGNVEGRNTKRIIWFKDLQTDVNPTWNILCSATPNSLDELKEDSANCIFIDPIPPQNAPITLPISGAGFIANDPPKFVFVTPDRLDVEVNVIKNEFVRCIAANNVDFEAFTDFNIFWSLSKPALNDDEYGSYSIAEYIPPILGSEMFAPRENERHDLVMKVDNLLMATRYTVSCATSTLAGSETSAEDSSAIISATPIYQSTRGNTEAILSVYPNYVVANERTLLHLNTHILGDNFYKLIAFTRKTCDEESIVSPSYLQYKSSSVFVLFSFEDLGELMMCLSGDGGDTFWLQDNKDAMIDVTATSRHSIIGIVATWAVLGERTVFDLKTKRNIVGDGWSKKIGLSLDGCDNIVMDEYIEKDKNEIIFTLQTFDVFNLCYSDDYGEHWSLQITPHLSITGYSTQLGAANAKLKFVKLFGVDLDRPFHSDILHYFGVLHDALKDIQIEYEAFEAKSNIQIFVNNQEMIEFENSYKIPIYPSHILDQTLILFEVIAPNKMNHQKYLIEIKRSSNWNENIIQNIAPKNVLSNINTMWTLYPVLNGDNNLIRIGFVYDDDESDCRMPQISIAVDAYSQTKGRLVWNYYGVAKYRICYSIDGGKMWHKQVSDDAIVVVDGSYLRTPWHCASFILIFFCLFCQCYCARLRKLSKILQNHTN